jgi:hypothetical protein
VTGNVAFVAPIVSPIVVAFVAALVASIAAPRWSAKFESHVVKTILIPPQITINRWFIIVLPTLMCFSCVAFEDCVCCACFLVVYTF